MQQDEQTGPCINLGMRYVVARVHVNKSVQLYMVLLPPSRQYDVAISSGYICLKGKMNMLNLKPFLYTCVELPVG